MNNVERLEHLLGGNRAVARAAEVSQPLVSQWKYPVGQGNGQGGNIPPRFNLNILLNCRDNVPEGRDPDAYMNEVKGCLTMACPHCGRDY